MIKPDTVVVDVGAHVGDSSVYFGAIAGLQGEVLAFEPNPSTFRVLAEFAIRNRNVMRITPIPLAMDTTQGATTFEYGDYWLDNGGDHRGISVWKHGSNYRVPVNTVRLSEFLKWFLAGDIRSVSFIKLDCEGLDLLILDDFLESWPSELPAIQFELLDKADFSRRLFEKLSNLFSVMYFESQKMHTFNYKIWQLNPTTIDLVCVPKTNDQINFKIKSP